MYSRGHLGRSRSTAFGRVITAGGGGPNQPIVVMASSAVWTHDNKGETSWGDTSLWPSSLTPHWCIQRDGDIRTIREIIDADAAEYLGSRNRNAKVLVCTDVGQNPAASDLMRGKDFDDPVQFLNVRVNAGVEEGNDHDHEGRQTLGAKYLASWFDQRLWKNPKQDDPPHGVYGSPYVSGRTVVAYDPAQYETPEAGLSWKDVGRAAAATESLIRRAGVGDGDILVDLTGDETVAIALMLQLWAIGERRPSANAGPIHYRAPHTTFANHRR